MVLEGAGLTKKYLRVVGLDWAVSEANRAAVVLEKLDEQISVVDVITPVCDAQVAELCTSTDNKVLAVDIPFSWPREFSKFVARWKPSTRNEEKPPRQEDFRYRCTDRFVHERTGKWPLSVSTNLFSLGSLEWASIIHEKKLERQVVVSRDSFSATNLPAIIEVYPGATLKVFENDDSIPISEAGEKKNSYKKDETTRRSLVKEILKEFEIRYDDSTVERIVSTGQKDHATDGLLAALTALIFLDVVKNWSTWDPGDEHIEDAKKEGWIFFPKKRGENEQGNESKQ